VAILVSVTQDILAMVYRHVSMLTNALPISTNVTRKEFVSMTREVTRANVQRDTLVMDIHA